MCVCVYVCDWCVCVCLKVFLIVCIYVCDGFECVCACVRACVCVYLEEVVVAIAVQVTWLIDVVVQPPKILHLYIQYTCEQFVYKYMYTMYICSVGFVLAH